jgi:DNA-binding beta-propeller fold protein YncE
MVGWGAATAWAKPVTVAYVANAGNNHIQILDVDTGKTLNKLYTGVAPWRLIESPDEKRLLVQHWYSESTAVVNLATNEIETVLPVRGPGAFTPKGDKFWTYSWPGSFFQAYDGKKFKVVEQRQTEDRGVYDLLFWGKDRVYQAQYDPMRKGARTVYDYVSTARLDDPKHLSSTIKTGSSPIKLVVDPTGEFLLTANVDDRDVTIINEHGATARITLGPGPRDILFARNGKRMIVICWKAGTRTSEIFTLTSDFSVRPWPAIKADLTARVPGGLTAAILGPGGRTFYALDRPGKRLVTFDAETLKEIGSIPVGDEPTTFIVRQVSSRERNRLAQKTESRKRLEAILENMKSRGAAFGDVSFIETMTTEVVAETSEGDTNEKNEKAASPQATKTVTSTIRTSFKLPDSVRQEFTDGGVRLAQGGRAVSMTKEGRFHDTPRQDLLYVLYALYGLPTHEVIRHLAGDIPGSPYLRSGIAVDLVRDVEEEGHRYYAIGATGDHDGVSQLWVSAETGLPVSLVEQFPMIRAKNPHGKDEGFRGLTETRLQYRKTEEGYALPVKLSRYIDGKEIGWVDVSQAVFNQQLPAARFDLARLGGVVKAKPKKIESTKGAKPNGPGSAVTSLGNAHVDNPLAEHAAYNSSPPTSGPHTPYLAEWGVHRIPIPPETQVHNLEDGGVLLQYSCPTPCPELIEQLETISTKYERVVIAPYPLMDRRIALTAWERIDLLDDFDEKRIIAFVEAYHGHDHHPPGGEAPEPSPQP